MDKTYFLSQSISLTLVILISLIFVFLGFYNSKKYQDLNNYLTANRSIGLFSLTTSLTASALGAWILFGPASAASWGGIGAIIGYSLGTAFPMFFLIYLGKKIRKELPRGSSLIEFMRKKFRKSLFKLILLMIIFYMFIFLCAEVTAVAILINYISGTELWITALIVLMSTLAYTLYGGLRASIFTDNIQMIVIGALLLISLVYINPSIGSEFSFEFIYEKNPQLLSLSYVPGYTAGLTFFIAVAATNLFHQGNWQRVYAAKNFETLKKSLMISFFIIIPIVFYMGFAGMVAFSIDPTIRPDLGFFTLLLKEQTELFSLFVIVLGLALTISTVDTLINAISSLIVVDGKAVINLNKKTNYLNLSKKIILFLSFISFIVASKGFDILYLFLLADLFCCAFVLTVFVSFYDKSINEKLAYFSILVGLVGGFLLFPTPDFSKSLLVGILISKDLFPSFVAQSLLFLSFIIATFLPLFIIKMKKLHIS
ncbi:sodium:solute symporter family transporter [Candidatus Pelagibacter sp. RS39]|uniref:sodium:solute symporter family transporter n=1 Tax=Candidatus Pelagibacter sp. RS39 TaxID=1977864 RepID=UPI000A148787|nr:sodium:solute symporter [Candidatus Pelagibacter sp. RS39]ARJ48422.1 sodium:solute symporter [Candidatus Pelagibacter sp. RS39]